MRRSVLQIRTPEGIVFSQDLAGPTARFLAWLIDLLIVVALIYAANIAVGVLGWLSPELAQALSLVAVFALNTGYKILAEWFWRGQTVGKRVMRLRVMDAEGMRLQFSQVVLRNLLRFADLLPIAYLVGGVAMLINSRAQRLGDLAAGTVVVRIPKIREPDIDQLFSGKFNSLRHHPHLVARLRQQISSEEASLAFRALMRREEFEPGERVRLFADLAEHFRHRVKFPAEALDGITDEQYVRNLVDVLYRTQQPVAECRPTL